MTAAPNTRPVLSDHPNLVVIYVRLRARTPHGLPTILKYGCRIRGAAAARPDGLLRNEMLTWGLVPLHLGMRQDWRDFDTLERWARGGPHLAWWRATQTGRGLPGVGDGTSFALGAQQ